MNVDIAAAGPGGLVPVTLQGAHGTDVTLTLAAGGSGVVGKLMAIYDTLPD